MDTHGKAVNTKILMALVDLLLQTCRNNQTNNDPGRHEV